MNFELTHKKTTKKTKTTKETSSETKLKFNLDGLIKVFDKVVSWISSFFS